MAVGGGDLGGVHGGGKLGEGGDYAMFKDLMTLFNDERTKMEAKYKYVGTPMRL